MNDILSKSLILIDDIINYTEVKNTDFYSRMLDMMSSLYENLSDFSTGIFFIENTDCTIKAAKKKNKRIKEYNFQKELLNDFIFSDKKTLELQTKEDGFLLKETFVVKLAIRSSVFGFCILSLNNKPDNNIKTTFASLVSALSYKIKDFELNEVFKIQLKAMQEAIEEKENAYEIIKKQHKKLQELDKTKSLFLANISHELRTPLNAIIGFSQALDSKIFGDLNEKQAEYIKDIQISSLHLLGMINEILDISKLEAHAMKFSPSKLNPKQVIEEVLNILEPLFKNKDIEVIFNSDYDGLIFADYQKIQQILYNLLSNAIKFTPPKGRIEITSDNNKKDYILKIKDNGIGIEKKNHTKIFKKFVQLNNIYTKNQSSTGLGLTITKELVKLHGGKITLESEPDKGSTFTMEFKKIVL